MSTFTPIAWEDAVELAAKHPETFTRPGPKRLAALRIGDLAKVCTGNERFWCEITQRDGDKFIGRVDNDLLDTDRHGLKRDDIVHFEERHIYQAELKPENLLKQEHK